jgi:aryl-alcohol dehydrogenase-like predicted oxidoreductase
METRRLGRTGHQSSVAVLGAAAFWDGDEDVAARSWAAALEAGVNHLDVAPRYGEAQRVLGPLLEPVRDRIFVGCKTGRHQAAGVRAQLEESLTLLHCDAFDLYQMHAVTSIEELDRRAGAVEAMLAAREEGLCRWVGVTGHELAAPEAHLEALRRYDLDTVMFPVNPRLWADPDYRRSAEALLEETAARDVGVMAIKAAAARPWAGRTRTSNTWYEPYTAAETVARHVRFVLSVPGVHAFCTPGDADVLALALEAAQGFEPLDSDELTQLPAAVAGEPALFRPEGDSLSVP